MKSDEQTPAEQPAGEEADVLHAEQMRRRKASYDARKAAATREKGLIIVHTGTGKGKTSALQEVATCINAPLVNINLELSRRLLDLTERRRAVEAVRFLSKASALLERSLDYRPALEAIDEDPIAGAPLLS